MRRHSQLPIHGHRNGWGIYSRSPHIGIDYVAFQKFWRLAGADHLHVNGLRNKFCEPDDSVVASARACLTPLLGGYTVMPVFSSGQSAQQAPDTYRGSAAPTSMFLAGGGIMAHAGRPGRRRSQPAAGVGGRHDRRAAGRVRRHPRRSAAWRWNSSAHREAKGA